MDKDTASFSKKMNDLENLSSSKSISKKEYATQRGKILGTNSTSDAAVTNDNATTGKDRGWMAVVTFCCAFGSFIPYIGFALFVCSVVFFLLSCNSKKRGLATAGLILAIFGVSVGTALIIPLAGFFSVIFG